MMAAWVAAAALLVALGAIWRFLGLWLRRRRFHVRLRAPDPGMADGSGGPWIRSWIPLFAGVGRTLTWNRAQAARWLELGGSPVGWDQDAVAALRGLALTTGLLTGTLLKYLGLAGPVTMLVCVVAGYLWPDYRLWSWARRRQAQLAADVGDVMDLIATCLEAQAGLTIPKVLERAESHLDGPLREEIRLLNRQVEMGMNRDAAYQELLARNDCPELAALVEPLRRGGELGVPIAETVRAQAAVTREIRRRRARWAGERADLWVSVITFSLSMPAALVFIFALFLLILVTQPETLGLRLG